MASLQNWIAFEELHRPLFREHGAIYFSNSNKPSRDFNYAVSKSLFCSCVFYVLNPPLQPIRFSFAAAASFLGDPRKSIHSCLQPQLHLRMHTPIFTPIFVPRAYDLLVSGWIVGPGNSRFRMSGISRHPVAHAQCDKLLLRLLSIRKPETFCRRINTTKERCESVFMANLKEILTTLLAATLKNHSLRLRLTAFTRYFEII